MWQRCTCFVFVVVLLALIPGSAALGAWNFLEDDALIGWWACDEGEGAVVADSSANGNDGAFVYGDPAWTTGAYGSAITLVGPTLVEVPPMNLTLTEATMAGWVLPNGTQTDWASIMMHRFGDPAIAHGFNLLGNGGLAYHWNDSSMTWSFRPAGTYSDTEWTFCALTVAPDKATFYINGEATDENVIAHDPAVWEGAVYLGGDGTDDWVSRRMNGSLDDVSFFGRALSLDEILAIMGGPAAAGLAAWEDVAMAAAPTFFATDVVDGIYDIGALSGDITYEFIVQSNPAEEQASMALIGRRNFGDTEVGLKYEQWNNTGTYGATVFGVADYDYGVATNPGMPTHLVFVSSEDTATTTLYVDGALQGSIDSAITLAGPVGIGNAAQAEDGSDFFDDFDGDIFGVAIYDAALSAGQIRTHADAYLMRGAADITAAGDAVVGDPNDGDWPGAETPDLAIDDDVNTKYLHFKGATEPTGFEVAPALGATVVTGLTLTTANDAPERDPVAFELYGSNESIEGPFVLIATGDVNDFAGEEAWPRFTMNATPIEFANNTAYAYYQIMFTAVRDAASANSMQIAEVELIGAPGPAVLFAEDFEGLPLGPNVDEGVAGDAVWTKTAPEGWLIDDSEMAGVGDPNTDGVTEWAGWSFADKAWWIEAAGNQDRSLFTFGSGTVAVGDPDEWDDADHTEGYFNSFLATPIIDLAGVAADAVQLRFASSWRPEFDDNYHQTANITVSFDGADPVEVLLWESDSASANYKPYATNEAVVVEIAVPEGAQNMVVTFGLYDAGNDWWWAIDNVDVVCN
jgi:concanavalin A-like lectin/glucanase superfamily protein